MKYFIFCLLFIISLCISDVTPLDDDSFDDVVLKGNSDWCGHCKRLHPTWEKLATELKGKVKFGKIDGTEETILTRRFNLEGYPTLLLFFDNKYVEFDGSRTFEELKTFAIETYKTKTANEVPKAFMPVDIMFERLSLMMGRLLYDHPFISCTLLILVGLILGVMLTATYYAIFDETRDVDPMDEEPEKEKQE